MQAGLRMWFCSSFLSPFRMSSLLAQRQFLASDRISFDFSTSLRVGAETADIQRNYKLHPQRATHF